MKIFLKVVASALSTVMLFACSGSDDSSRVEPEAVKTNFADITFAAYDDSLVTAKELQAAVDRLIETPTDSNLVAAKNAYKATRLPYQQAEITRFDTPITLGKNLNADGGPSSVDDWEGQVNAWPLDENFIISIIEGDQTINKELLISQNGANNNEANVTTGVHAVEFMLWGEDENGTGPGAGMRPVLDFALGADCIDALCERRAQYLKSAIDLLVDDLTEMTSEWNTTARITPGTLAHNFLNSDDALAYVVSAMKIMATDELASARMSSGLELGDPEESHDCFSDLSHIAIYGNFQGVQNAFFGTYGVLAGPSLADLVKQTDESTYDNVVAALSEVEALMLQIRDAGEREINTVRYDQIIGQDFDGVERRIAQEAVEKLVALDFQFQSIQELLSLTNIDTSGSGDGD